MLGIFCTIVGGVLSPLLSNLVLDELDRELEPRGHRFVRYADDCNIYPASLTRVRCIGSLIERKFFCDKALSRSRGSPRCQHSVTRTCLRLHLLKAARSLPRSMVAQSPATPVRCCWGPRIGCWG